MKKIVLIVTMMVVGYGSSIGQTLATDFKDLEKTYTTLNYQADNPNELVSLKSPQKAFLLSFGHFAIPTLVGTLLVTNGRRSSDMIGGVILAYGVSVGPSMGNFYARDATRGWGGFAIRILGAGMMAGGVASGLNEIQYMALNNNQRNNSDGMGLFIAGALVSAAGVIFNLATAGKSAEEYNRKHSTTSLSIVPVYYPHEQKPGLAIHVNF